VSDQFAAQLLWLDDTHLLPGRSYGLVIGARRVSASVTVIKHRVDMLSRQHLAARNLEINEIGVCNLATSAPIAFDAFADNRATGSFLLVDRMTQATAAVGMIMFGLRRATNIHVEELIVDKSARATAKNQRPTVIWFTGLSGSGKSTIAKRLEKRLHDLGNHTYVLDGDNVRHGLNQDLGFTDTDRVENIRRIGEVAKLFADAGLIVMCAFISPFRAERRMVRELLKDDEFVEVYVDASIVECQRRDPKGLYAKALAGKVKNFTGIDSPYESPERAEIHLTTENVSPDVLVDQILGYLREKGRI
jgi:bifunctional enzyme CysN/CysC